MSDKRVDISDEITRICEKFGMDKTQVLRIEFWPTAITFEIARLRNGAKFIDEETNEQATDLAMYKVTT